MHFWAEKSCSQPQASMKWNSTPVPESFTRKTKALHPRKSNAMGAGRIGEERLDVLDHFTSGCLKRLKKMFARGRSPCLTDLNAGHSRHWRVQHFGCAPGMQAQQAQQEQERRGRKKPQGHDGCRLAGDTLVMPGSVSAGPLQRCHCNVSISPTSSHLKLAPCSWLSQRTGLSSRSRLSCRISAHAASSDSKLRSPMRSLGPCRDATERGGLACGGTSATAVCRLRAQPPPPPLRLPLLQLSAGGAAV